MDLLYTKFVAHNVSNYFISQTNQMLVLYITMTGLDVTTTVQITIGQKMKLFVNFTQTMEIGCLNQFFKERMSSATKCHVMISEAETDQTANPRQTELDQYRLEKSHDFISI